MLSDTLLRTIAEGIESGVLDQLRRILTAHYPFRTVWDVGGKEEDRWMCACGLRLPPTPAREGAIVSWIGHVIALLQAANPTVVESRMPRGFWRVINRRTRCDTRVPDQWPGAPTVELGRAFGELVLTDAFVSGEVRRPKGTIHSVEFEIQYEFLSE